MDGISVRRAEEVVRARFNSDYDHLGRKWLIVRDSSVPSGFELVTPPIHYDDIPILQDLFRRLRTAGARRSPLAGIHIHVEARNLLPRQVQSLVNVYSGNVDLILQMLNVDSGRRLLYAQPVEPFARRLNALNSPATWEELRSLWYVVAEASDEHPDRYNSSRYTEINLNSLFYRQTIEFRAFNSTNHAGKLRTILVLVLALTSFARRYDGVYPLHIEPIADKSTAAERAVALFSLLSIGGPEFRRVRDHLLAGIEKHYRPKDDGSSVVYCFEGQGMFFEGDSHRELLDQVVDGRFLDDPNVQAFLTKLRKRSKSLLLKPWLAHEVLTVSDHDGYARAILSMMEREGLGLLTTRGA
ncbi:Putative amidoligase enzyme [Micromonospora narathiwatensis]|uniref:Putative amidoligase enzyme n=2 Tax=Micromonospora narathiwatensis TaxID=299146 RepID=A0A1A8ZJV9_9ACTN|nr:Putative amidoligase enzyme [Micromonospora narathiwatensis]